MGAPSTAYFNNDQTWLEAHQVAVAIRDIKFPVLATAYPIPLDFKQKFYCDFLFDAFEKQNGVSAGVFLAAVIVDGANSKMHAANRFSGLEFWQKQGDGSVVRVVVLNDGGLHTKGLAVINSIPYKWANNIGINMSFLSAFFLSTNNIGVRVKGTSESIWTEILFAETIAADASVTGLRHITPTFNYLDSIDIQAILLNDEEPYYGPTTTIVLDESVGSYGALKRSLACSTSGQESVIIWIKETQFANFPLVTTLDANTGIFLYTDVTMTVKAGAGWYYALDGSKAFEVNSNGEVRKYQVCGSSLPVANLYSEQDIEGRRRFKVSLSEVYSSDIVVSFRIDISSTVTVKAKYVSITVVAGQTLKNDPLYRDLSDGVYHIYDATVSPGSITLIVTPI